MESLVCNKFGATVMVATACIAAAVQIDTSYLPGGANAPIHLIHASLSPRNGISIG